MVKIKFSKANNFCSRFHNIFYCFIGSKRKRMGTNSLKNFIVTSSTSDQYNSSNQQSSFVNHFKTTAFYPIIDALIVNLKKRFSPESLEMAVSVDNFFKLNFKDSLHFIDHYHVCNQ